jgi:hypothetical protein
MKAPERQEAADDTSALGTLGWVGAVILGAILALALLSWLGPVGWK